jgi:hypothetical protein
VGSIERGQKFPLSVAKRKCAELGDEVCFSITCLKGGHTCELNGAADPLIPSKYGEDTFIPPEGCDVLQQTLMDLEDEVENEDVGEDDEDLSEVISPKEDIITDWVNYMHDFESSMLVNIIVKGRKSQVFYEDVKQGDIVRGAFFASEGDVARPVNFNVLSPTGNLVAENTYHEAVFHFRAKEDGAYKFMLTNPSWTGFKTCTFTVGTTEHVKIATHDLDHTETKIHRIKRVAMDAQAEASFLWQREHERLAHHSLLHKRIFHFAVGQFCVYAVTCLFQIYYLKGLLSDRRVL